MPIPFAEVRAGGHVLCPLIHIDKFLLDAPWPEPIHQYPVVPLAPRIVVHPNDLDPGLLDLAVLLRAQRNGDVIATDDANHRVIVVDPKTDAVVWQYGVRGQPGDTPGLLNAVDGLDLVPPHSELVVHAKTMGLPPASMATKSAATRS